MDFCSELISAFFESASRVLHPNGEVHVVLCEGQGGATSRTIDEWRRSWMAPLYASQAGLLLHQLVPYQVSYNNFCVCLAVCMCPNNVM